MNTVKSFLLVILSLMPEQQGCKGPFNQTAYTTAKTTITCDDLKYDDESRVKFFCKEKGVICEEISSNGRFILTNTNSFNMSISNVSSEDTGVYWCGLKSRGRGHRTALRKIQLEVQNITNFERSAMVGKTFKYWCNPKRKEPLKLLICKGEDPSTCKQLVSTAESNIKNGKFSLTETKKRNFTITVTNITADDAGTYWCGAESSDTGRSNLFFHRFIMTVAPSTSPPPSTQSTTASAETHGGFEVIITVIVCVAVLLLLLVLILILICKRFSHSKKTRNGTTAQHVREDYVYEEIQEHLPKPDRGNAMDTIYVSVNLPTNPSASLHYSTINFQNSSEKAGGKTPKPSSSACEYSTVKTIQSPTYLTVIQPSTSMEDTLYSTVNKPQQQKGKIHPVRNI
ncbi:CMRF35-like molecule 1 isoform X4 [Trachinotus anak]|uniref:CMRF35-like molecule 1 isoform X4 n=1 Tax=Trachinotus anak TaxID=443729 RepID=UPI0039F2387D